MSKKPKTKPKPDRYDIAIQQLLDAPNFEAAVYQAWNDPYNEPGGALFEHVRPQSKGWSDNNFMRSHTGGRCGCLTQIKDYQLSARTVELTEQIRADYRIPLTLKGVTKGNITVFAIWQRRIDKILGRVHPVLAVA